VFGRRHVKSRRDLVRAEFGTSMDHARQAAVHAAGGLGATVGPRLGSAKDSAKDKTSSARGVVGPTAGRVSSAASRSWDSTLAAFAPLAEAARDGSARAAKLDAKNKDNKGNRGNKERKNSKGKEAASSMLITTKTTTKESTSHTGLYAILATGAAVGAAGALVARRRTRAKWAEYEPSSLNSDASSFLDAGATSTKSFGGKTSAEGSEVTDHADAGAVTKAANSIKEHCKSAATTLRKKVHEATADPDGTVSEKIDDAGDKMNEGANHLADKAEAKLNAAKTPGGGSATNTSGAAGRGEHMSDEVDDLIRSAKNGRM